MSLMFMCLIYALSNMYLYILHSNLSTVQGGLQSQLRGCGALEAALRDAAPIVPGPQPVPPGRRGRPPSLVPVPSPGPVSLPNHALPRQVTRRFGVLLNAEPSCLVFTPNATYALNSVIRSFPLQPGDSVFALSIGYGSVKIMLEDAAQRAGATLVEAQVRFPLPAGSEEEALEALVAQSLPPTARLAVFDAVTSNTAVRLPIHALVRLCHARGCAVLVDGAHALGAMPVDLRALGADFWVSNCHKHLCGARGAAVLYAAPQHQARLGLWPGKPHQATWGTPAWSSHEFLLASRPACGLLSCPTAQLLGSRPLSSGTATETTRQSCHVRTSAWSPPADSVPHTKLRTLQCPPRCASGRPSARQGLRSTWRQCCEMALPCCCAGGGPAC